VKLEMGGGCRRAGNRPSGCCAGRRAEGLATVDRREVATVAVDGGPELSGRGQVDGDVELVTVAKSPLIVRILPSKSVAIS
jgi:hypothetical protein